jgi:23S rRNA pseudouridine2605 synthase
VTRRSEGEARSGERLQKVLARAGLGSRRSNEDLIKAGRITVNGRRAELGSRVDPSVDTVAIDGIEVALEPELVYLALNKPTGVVTTAKDPQKRRTVIDLVPREPRVIPVGRLDRDTSGLLLLTNDGDFANRIAHPRYEVPKTYVAEVRGKVTQGLTHRLERGVTLEDGPAHAESVRIREASRGRTILEITVREGRNRLVRRIFESQGLTVTSLVRTAIGPVRLGRLREGDWRELKRSEVLELLRSGAPVD